MADQYNSPEEMASAMSSQSGDTKGQQYSSPEDMANQLISGPPTITQKIGSAVHDLSGSTYDTFFGSNGILTNAAQAGNDAWGAKPFQKMLTQFTNLKDTDSTLTHYAKGFNSVVLRPVAGAADAVLALGATDLTALSSAGEHAGEALNTTAQHLPAPLAAPVGELGDIIGATTASERGGQPLTGQYFPEAVSTHLEHQTSVARAKAALGEGEESYFNTIKPDEETVAARQTAANKAGIEPAPVHPTTNTNIDWVARQTNPEAFKEWEAKLDYHDELENRLNQLQAEEPEGNSLLGESPELSQAKEAYRENYNRLKELEPEIDDAYKHAQSLMPPEEDLQKIVAEQADLRTASRKAQEAEEEKVASDTGVPQETPVAPSEGLWRAPKGSISDIVAKKMMATGTPEDIAKAAGQLSEAHYNARADRFGGRLGSALDIYKREGPEILGNRAKSGAPRNARVLNQRVRKALDHTMNRLVVARKLPDGSIKKGTPGQLHLDLIDDAELERKSLGFVHMDEDDMGFSTPDGKYLNRKEALDWVKQNTPELNEQLMHGGPRNKSSLESVGYENELDKAQLKRNAEHGVTFNQEDEVPENLGINAGKTRFEHEAEVSDIAAQAVKAFNDKYYGADRFKSVDEIATHNQEAAPIFYSALSKGVDNINTKKATGEQWSKTIDNLQGIKKEEVEWSGIKDWLKEQKGQVSKEDVQKFLKENEVNVQEVEKSGSTSDPDNFNSPNFSPYALPGGENYKELLLTLPEDKGIQHENGDVEAGKNFRSSHWDEPNVLSHIRFDDRTGPNGEKILHIAEVQSDWHQKGRKVGYANDHSRDELVEVQNKLHAIRSELDDMLDRHGKLGFDTTNDARLAIYNHHDLYDYDTPEDAKLAKDYSELAHQKDRLQTRIHAVPDAPFKQTWQELSMKRMLRYAVENGYDKLSWDTGQTNFERMQGSKLEGQQGFYDKILPDFMKKYVKKWDGKVEDTEIKTGFENGPGSEEINRTESLTEADEIPTYSKIHSVDITPKMKDSVMRGQPLFQQKRGSLTVYNSGRNILRLFKAQNPSTPFHELGHQWLEELSSDATHAEAPEDLKRDWETVKTFLGVTEEQKGITSPQHELFARTFERYLREGVAPSEELKSVFEKIKDWMVQVYQHISQLNAPISDEVRKVFDNLLTEKETREAVEKESETKTPETAEPTAEEPTNILEQGERPRHKRLGAIKGTGEEANYGLANRINNILQTNFDSELTEMDTRQRADFKLGAAQVAEHVATNPQEAYEIAMGNRPASSINMTPEMYWNAMTQYATTKKDLQMLSDLSQSRLVREVTTMAQRLASLRSGYDTTAMPNAAMIMKSIEEARQEFFQRGNPSQPGSQGIKTKQPLSVDEQTKLVDLTDTVQQNYLKYKTTDNYNDRITWGKSFLDLKKYVDSLKPKYKSTLDRAQEYAGEAVGAFKQMQTGIGHLSAIMVQGLGSMSHPEFYKGAAEMLKYFASPNAYQELQAHIVTDPWYRHAQSANLGLTNISTKLNNLEEELGSHLLARVNEYAANKTGLPINIMGASSRAFTGYLNYLRYNVFAKSMEAAKLSGEDVSVNGQVSKDIAEAINNFTGRANLGTDDRLRNASRALNMLFYAPRKLVSTFEVFNPWQYAKPQSPTARTLKFRNLMGVSLGVGSALLLAKGLGADVNFDPTSNDFGEIQIGKTKVDIMPGFRTAIRFMAQVGVGTQKTKDGKVIDLDSGNFNAPNRATVALQFMRGKEAPFASLVTDRLMNYDAVGNEFNLTRELKQKLTPIVYNNFANFIDNDAENGAAWPLAAMTIFGVGVSEPLPEASRQGLNVWGDEYSDLENKPQNDLDRIFKEAGVTPSFPAKTMMGVKLNDSQYHDYIQISGQTLAQNAKLVTSLPGWNDQPQSAKKALLESYRRAARTQAASALGIQPANQDLLNQWNGNPNPGLQPELQQLYQTPEQANPQ